MDNILIIAMLIGIVALACIVIYLVSSLRGLRRDLASSQKSLSENREIMAEERRRLADTVHIHLEAAKEAQRRDGHAQAEQLRLQSQAQFESLSSQLLKTQSDCLREENSRQLDSMLSPLRQRLEEFTRSVNDCYVKDNAERKSLSDQILRLMDLNQTIGQEAKNLTQALKGDSKVQGDWGEMVLETLLESAGLEKGINFFTQVGSDASGHALTDAEGRRQRPDVVVKLPDGHSIIVDSKVSLTAYSRYIEATSDEEKLIQGKAHLRSVRKHIDELGDKQYHKQIADAAEHMLMFMPVEGAYFAAMQLDQNLWKYAFDRHVVIVSPTHIFSVMQILAQLWRQDKQNRNAEQIARLGGLLYDRFASFVGELEDIERNLESLHKSYDRAYKTLTGGSQSLLRRAERLREMGAKTSRNVSPRAAADAELRG